MILEKGSEIISLSLVSEEASPLLSYPGPSISLSLPLTPPPLRGDSVLQKCWVKERSCCQRLEGIKWGRKVMTAEEWIRFDSRITPERILRSMSVICLPITSHHPISRGVRSKRENFDTSIEVKNLIISCDKNTDNNCTVLSQRG